MEIVIGMVILYVIQAVLIYGMTFGYFSGEFPRQQHRGFATSMALIAGLMPILGPSIIFWLSDAAKHGLRYK